MQATTTLYAQPYDITAIGFYFSSAEQFHAKAAKLANDHGDPLKSSRSIH